MLYYTVVHRMGMLIHWHHRVPKESNGCGQLIYRCSRVTFVRDPEIQYGAGARLVRRSRTLNV